MSDYQAIVAEPAVEGVVLIRLNRPELSGQRST